MRATFPQQIRVACPFAFAMSVIAVLTDVHGPLAITGPACAATACLRSIRRPDRATLLLAMGGLGLAAIGLRLRPNAPPSSVGTWIPLVLFLFAFIAVAV